ncbi:MAG: molybdopterin-dependent oxidoreductase [Dehalococcoidales bacterium]|nr:molybdopterin-dependent oxidoreductase [Dehalococcoidales bacterium]
MSEKHSVIGKSHKRVDGTAKVTGSAKYTFDIVLPNMLYGKILRSPYPHAKIISIDTSEALKLPGVKAVVTGADTLGKKNGIWRRFPELCDEEILCREKVRYIGDPVAAVAAVDESTAEAALDLIEVDYEPLEPVFDPREAMQEGAPQIHDHAERNINNTRHIEWGNVDEDLEKCDVVIEEQFYSSPQAHVCMETHGAVADFDHDGHLTMYTSTQSNYYIQVLLSDMFDLREGDIRVIKPPSGGGFGSKIELDSAQFCSALLSQKTRQPVKIILTREEEFTATKRKTPMYYSVRMGAMNDGTLVAKEVRVITEGGAYTGMGATALYLAGFYSCLPYTWNSYRYDGYRVYSNSAPASALRGFGAPQAYFVGESMIDMMAEKLGMDPMAIRRKNAVKPGHEVPDQALIQSCGLEDCYDAIEKHIKERGELPPNRAIGIANYGFMSGGIFNWFNTPYAFSAALVKINVDGKVDLFTGACDTGQGSDTTLSMICAEELGVHLNDIRVHAEDTAISPVDLGSWGSRETLMAGNAVKMAAADAKKQLLKYAYAKMGPNIVYDLDIKDHKVHIPDRPERSLSYFDIVKDAIRGNEGQTIIGRGHYTPHRKGMVSPAFGFGVQAAEVEVDPDTGKVTLIEIVTAHDCGQVINPVAVLGQVEGATHMAAGAVVCENQPSDNGKILNPSIGDYKILRALDMPKTIGIEVDTYEPEGPFGAKEAGEGLTSPTGGAIANAVYKACGVRIKDLPITPEKVFYALREQEKE